MSDNAWQTAATTINRCMAAGVSEFVICAGARNAALIEAIARAEEAGHAKIWRHFEERSAGFFALGRCMKNGNPCAVVTTSGTAAAELLPAVIEAFYQNRPLVLITADRPENFRGSGAPQSIVQPGIFGPHAAESLAAWDGNRPLHLNIELGETFDVSTASFTSEKPAEFSPAAPKPDVAALARWLREDLYSGLVVMIGGLEPEEREEVFHFCRQLGAPLVIDATSGLREALAPLAIHDADRLLPRDQPGKILRIGEVPTCRFWRDLENLTKISVWSVCRNGLPGLARQSSAIRGNPVRILRALGDPEPADDALDHLVGNSGRLARTEELLEALPDSEPALVRQLSHYACLGSSVFLGNSLPIREWNLFAQNTRPIPLVRANRGTNGIDGQISTWLGATASEENAWAVIGDLTTLYDLAGPFVLPQVENNGRVLAVINNRGGQIFSRLPHLATMSPRTRECMTNPHEINFTHFAKMWGFHHTAIRGVDDFDSFDPGKSPALLEIIPDPKQTERFWKEWEMT
ncbi:MAG: thiamine pyrophosphate-binding protein [Verrucomicrobiota bacterium]